MGLFGPNIDKMIREGDVAGLAQILHTSQNQGHRVKVVHGLWQIGTPSAISTLSLFTGDANPDVKRVAREAVRKTGGGGFKFAWADAGELVKPALAILALVSNLFALAGIISGNPISLEVKIPLISLLVGTVVIDGPSAVINLFGAVLHMGKWDLAGISFVLFAFFIVVAVLTRHKAFRRLRVDKEDRFMFLAMLLDMVVFPYAAGVLWTRAFLVGNFTLALLVGLVPAAFLFIVAFIAAMLIYG